MHHKTISYNKYTLVKNLALSFALITTAQAAIEHPLNEFKVIEAPISKQGLTRIAIKEDRIFNVFGITGEYILEADEDQGQIFIRPSEFNNKPINLTLTTEGGHTQDLRLIPQDKNPEAIILKMEDKNQKRIENKPYNLLRRDGMRNGVPHNDVLDNITRDEVVDLLQACREERIPLGYKLVPISIQERENFQNIPEPHVLVRELKGEKLRCLTYAVQNTSDFPLKLENQDFSQSQKTVAVFIPQKTLVPGERREVYVVAHSY